MAALITAIEGARTLSTGRPYEVTDLYVRATANGTLAADLQATVAGARSNVTVVKSGANIAVTGSDSRRRAPAIPLASVKSPSTIRASSTGSLCASIACRYPSRRSAALGVSRGPVMVPMRWCPNRAR